MQYDEVVRGRHSVRAYDDTRPVSNENIRALLEAARLAPSASNTQPTRLIAVTDKTLLKRLCTEGMKKIVSNKWSIQAPLMIVACSKLAPFTNRLGRAKMDSEYYQIDLGIAVEHLVLKATDLGLSTCWIGWFNELKVKEILNIPDQIRVHIMVTVGYAGDKVCLPAQHKRKPLEKLMFLNGWGNKL